jgi:2-polyprenyl-3-methyl-5-hydroxy-6-metoxy-1,4-benzoquinol methylase
MHLSVESLSVERAEERATPCFCGNSILGAKNICPVTFCYGSSYALKECHGCGLTYFDPTPTLVDLQKFYSTHGYQFNFHSQASRARFLLDRYLQAWPQGRFLDVGCASGLLLYALKSMSDLEVHGVELSKKAVTFANTQLKLQNVLNQDLLSAEYPSGFFDAIHISEVLEHVPSPVELLRECRRIIKPGGLFFLSLPNGLADRQGLIDYWKRYGVAPGHASGHIFFFSPESLKRMLNDTGFEICETHTYAFKQGLRSLGLLPRRPGGEGMFAPRTQPEVSNTEEIILEPPKHSEFFYRIKYGTRQRIRLPGLLRFGLGWDLVLRPR